MTHYIKINMNQFQAHMKDFTQRNIQWIEKVGRDVLDKSQLTVDSFVKGLIGGTIFFDELCLTVACRAFNVHCILLLDGTYWTTRPNNQLSDCLLRLAYVGEYGLKEICAENTAVIDEEATLEGNDSSESSELSGEDNEDLLGTGILTETAENSDVTDPKDKSDPKEKSDLTETTDSNDVDKKPLVMFMPPVDVHNTKDDPIVITDSDEDEIDVKPVIKFKPMMSTAVGEPIVISDSESEADQNNNDAAAASFNGSIPQVKRIKRDRNYTCYLCLQQFDMLTGYLFGTYCNCLLFHHS